MKAKIYNHSFWLCTCNELELYKIFKNILLQSGFNIIKELQHNFEPQGYTALWLLAESHLALHTFPEESKSYIELSSCNLELYVKFLELISALES